MPAVGIEPRDADRVVVVPHQPRALVVRIVILRLAGYARSALICSVYETRPTLIRRNQAKGPPSLFQGVKPPWR